MGIGFVLAVAKDKADEVLAQLAKQEISAWKIGKVAKAEKEVSSQEDAVIFE
jgi:phosphoribosylaminoimidazole (AIR) synthetase